MSGSLHFETVSVIRCVLRGSEGPKKLIFLSHDFHSHEIWFCVGPLSRKFTLRRRLL